MSVSTRKALKVISLLLPYFYHIIILPWYSFFLSFFVKGENRKAKTVTPMKTVEEAKEVKLKKMGENSQGMGLPLLLVLEKLQDIMPMMGLWLLLVL